jgi:hypothetical protein
MSALPAGEIVLLSLWTLWLLAALALLPYPVGLALVTGLAALGLALILSGVVSWRAYLIGGLAVHVVAAAVMIVRQGRGRGRGPDPGQLRQALLASVSLAGLIWLLILRPTISWLYPADIPIMLATVAALVAAEYGGWVFFERTVQQRVNSAVSAERQDAAHRAAGAASDLEREQRRRSAADEQNAQLQRTVRDLEDTQSQQQAELRRREDRLSQQQAELGRREAKLSEQEAELRRGRAELADALDALARQPPAWYRRPSDDASASSSSGVPGGAPAGPGPGPAGEAVDVVLLRLTVEPPAGSQPPAGGQPGQLVQVTVERATSRIWLRPGETPGQLQARAEGRLREEIDEAVAGYSAQASGQPAWNVVSRRWVATNWADINAAAGAVIDFQADLHHLLLGEPVQELGTWIGLPPPVTGALAGLAEAAGIPGDGELTAVVRIIQIGGIVLGAMSGQPLLACACFKSLIHDEAIRAVETLISREFGRLGLVRAEPPAPDPVRRPGPTERPSAVERPGPAERPSPVERPSPAEQPSPAERPNPAEGPSPTNGPGPARPGPAAGPDTVEIPPVPRPSLPPPWTPTTRPGRDDNGPGRPGMSPF